MLIPRIIHQTGPTPLPEWTAIYRDSLMKHHPDWKHEFWSDGDLRSLVRMHYPWLLDVYDKAQLIEKTDLGRYCVLHRFGGVYCDTDIYWRGRIGDITKQSPEATLWLATSPRTLPTDQKDDITNYLMASVPGHCFWLQVLADAKDALQQPGFIWKYNKTMRVSYCTGAKLLTKVFKDRFQTHDNVAIFAEPQVVNLFCAHTPVSKGAIAIHNGGTSRNVGSKWSSYVGVVKHECALRKIIGVRGNIAQFPFCSFILYSIFAVLVSTSIAGAVMVSSVGGWLLWTFITYCIVIAITWWCISAYVHTKASEGWCVESACEGSKGA